MNGYCAQCGTYAYLDTPTFWCGDCGEAWIEEQAAKEERRA